MKWSEDLKQLLRDWVCDPALSLKLAGHLSFTVTLTALLPYTAPQTYKRSVGSTKAAATRAVDN